MRAVFIGSLVLAGAVAVAAQQAPAGKQSSPDKNKPITLTGCVAPDATQNGNGSAR